MTFTGFPVEALDFYEGLEADNSKTYWTAHKHVYESCVREPLVALCELLEPEFGPVHLFRPYRDVRFARDKSPYKDQQGATVGDNYVHVSAAGLFAAGGYYRMAADQVGRFREAVDDDGTGSELEKEVDRLRGAGYTVGGDALKTRPRGYAADHPRVDLLRYRGLAAWVEFGSPPWVHTAEAVERVAGAWRDFAPLNAWLDTQVGPSRMPSR
jgi:uncharacterized protein (TIGR02453 family)